MGKIEKEKKTVSIMIKIYCNKVHKTVDLCNNCSQLEQYAHFRLDKCQFGDEKASCRKCPVHCYNKDMREKIREVMRFAGSRMLYLYPVYYFKH
jgi:hypothetical protein